MEAGSQLGKQLLGAWEENQSVAKNTANLQQEVGVTGCFTEAQTKQVEERENGDPKQLRHKETK